MTREKKKRVPLATVLLFVMAIALLLFSTLGGAWAVLIYSTGANAYTAEIEMKSTGITLMENKNAVANGGTILNDFGETDGNVIPGKAYEEEFYVVNSGDPAKGDLDEYVRVVIYKYWTDGEGKKDLDLSMDKIVPNLLVGGNWVEDANAKTEERTILYYTKPVAAGAATTLFMDTLKVDESVLYTVTQQSVTDANGRVTTTTNYIYDGATVCLEIEADGVQASHGEDAILSAWGRSVSIAGDGTLSLN